MMHRTAVTTFVLFSLAPAAVAAQDTVPPVEQGVRIGITYTPGLRPGMMVLGGPRAAVLDSVRAILSRDLDLSDRFEMISLPAGDSLVLGISGARDGAAPRGDAPLFVNYSLHSALGAEYSVAVLPTADEFSTVVALYDVRGEVERQRYTVSAMDATDERFRFAVHQVADELVRAAAGEPGIAASRLLFVSNGRLFRIDVDGAALTTVSAPGVTTFSPAWDPTGTRAVYTELSGGWGKIVVQDLARGTKATVRPTAEQLNYTAAVSRDGTQLAFSRSSEDGTDIYLYNLPRDCCLERLTVGRFSDNLSPTFSPDGRQIAFVSTRAGCSKFT
ncbi:MAG: PD40 domain-containing protein [Gemmatimonadales bacterium]|nr:PD40 domain-containing protein [Gemmatimonadales bacterium]